MFHMQTLKYLLSCAQQLNGPPGTNPAQKKKVPEQIHRSRKFDSLGESLKSQLPECANDPSALKITKAKQLPVSNRWCLAVHSKDSIAYIPDNC